jgi:uncharacterized protein YciI
MPPPKVFITRYVYVADILERRGPFREAHLAGAQQQVAAGRMLMAGAFSDVTDGAVFVWTSKATRADVEGFVASDPYCVANLVTSVETREWALPILAPGLLL